MKLVEIAPLETYPLVGKQVVKINGTDVTAERVVFFQKPFTDEYEQLSVQHCQLKNVNGRIVFEVCMTMNPYEDSGSDQDETAYLLCDGQWERTGDENLEEISDSALIGVGIDPARTPNAGTLWGGAPWQACVDPRLE